MESKQVIIGGSRRRERGRDRLFRRRRIDVCHVERSRDVSRYYLPSRRSPAGRLDEFGRIPDRYPVKELEEGSFAERTLQNVKDSEGTIVIYFNELRGGTDYTVQCCKQLQRPHKLINAANSSPQDAAELIVDV